jgi:hypothetical protein
VGPGTIHDSVSEAFRIPNFALSKALMLVMGFTLEVFDAMKAKDVKNTFTTLSLGVVREEAVGCAMVSDQILKSLGHVGFETHRVEDSLGTGFANIKLSHSSPNMPEDAIIMSWSVTEEGICSNTFIPAMDIVGREAGVEVFAHS